MGRRIALVLGDTLRGAESAEKDVWHVPEVKLRWMHSKLGSGKVLCSMGRVCVRAEYLSLAMSNVEGI